MARVAPVHTTVWLWCALLPLLADLAETIWDQLAEVPNITGHCEPAATTTLLVQRPIFLGFVVPKFGRHWCKNAMFPTSLAESLLYQGVATA